MKMEAFLAINSIYLLTALPLAGLVFLFSRFFFKIKEWYLSDLIMVLTPGFIYFIMDRCRIERLFGHSKTLANLVAELVILGVSCGLIFLLRTLLGRRFPEYSKELSLIVIPIIFILTVGIYIFMPTLPE